MKKIMFNDRYGLTQAVLDGRNTQTRRIITPQPTYQDNCGICWKGYAYGLNIGIGCSGTYNNFVTGTEYDESCNRYKKGEVVAVAQSYKDIYDEQGLETIDMLVQNMKNSAGWNNKMFVRADLMLHQIRIVNVRFEHLQDISDDDCLKEGINEELLSGCGYFYSFFDSDNSQLQYP